MAKTFDAGQIPVTFRADADLSSNQYYAVKAASLADYVKLANGGCDPAPVGILQDDDGDTIGNDVSVVIFGPTKAVVAACTVGGAACDVDFGHYLVAGSDGKLYYSSCGLYNARSLDFLSSGSAILNVQWLGSGCAYGAS